MKSLLLALFVGLLMVGSLQPASASGGWLWFDKYPWVYSHKEQGWIYLLPSGGKLFAYRPSDKSWSEFSVTESPTDAAGNWSVDLNSTVAMDMIWCPPGTFTMGSPESEVGRQTNGEGEHNVTLTKGFYLGKHEVTQAQWEAVMGGVTGDNVPANFEFSSHNRGIANLPVDMVLWDEVQVFLSRLDAFEQAAGRLPTGWAYELPTEAEWEYACRAGTTTAYSWGDDINATRANYKQNQSQEVGGYAPNPWGFYDMHGNVWEWTSDWKDWSGYQVKTPRVIRGGCSGNPGTFLRSAHRGGATATGAARYGGIGFRVALKQQ